ncbi:MAG: aspartyl/glutamyl-tRNA amidotransferase subunit C [Candidatus Dojkabacteria bacterium]|nr:aspartyl/glutamyl-tRNA amidotransferase subunit C [Candidatus Dojkabacteria bacterium]
MITKEQIIKILDLAKISIDDSEIENFIKEIGSILEYVAKIKECNVKNDDISMAHFLNNYVGTVLREDVLDINSYLSQNLLFVNIPNKKTPGNYLRINKSEKK